MRSNTRFTPTAPNSFTTVLGAFPNDSVRRPAIHQGFYRALDNGFSEWHSTDIGALFFLIGARVVRHNRYTTFQMAAVAIDQPLFAEIA